MKKSFLFFLCALWGHGLIAQGVTEIGRDSLKLTISEAENLFLQKNLDLIAQHYSIDSAQATIITARLYSNPELDLSNAFYNPENGSFFSPERTVQLSQLIRLAGKRSKAVKVAQSGVDIAQNEFYDLMRNLRYVLRNDFYNIYFLEQSAKVYQTEISSLQRLVTAFQDQVSKGFMAPADALRIQSQLYTLQAEYDNLQGNITDVQGELKSLILADPAAYFVPLAEESIASKSSVEKLSYQLLIDSALANRPDLKALNANVIQGNYNLALQKAMATPDITVNANYDRLGGYVKNYNGIGISIPIPFFDRNQGNIRNAKIQIDASKTQYESAVEKVKNEVTTNYISALRSEKLLQGFDPKFEDNLKNLIEQVTLNFQKKNLSLLEFLDHYDSYKQNVLQMNQLRFNKMSALEQLNLSVGKIIFNQ